MIKTLEMNYIINDSCCSTNNIHISVRTIYISFYLGSVENLLFIM
jgi:hypothetical protein